MVVCVVLFLLAGVLCFLLVFVAWARERYAVRGVPRAPRMDDLVKPRRGYNAKPAIKTENKIARDSKTN